MTNLLRRSLPSTFRGRLLWWMIVLGLIGLPTEFLSYITFGAALDPLSFLLTILATSVTFAVLGEAYQRAFKDDDPKR